jgi:hypothetical protein
VDSCRGLYSGKPPASLEWKQLAVTNTLAYYDMINYGRKRFNSTGPWGLTIKIFAALTFYFRKKLECLPLSVTSTLVKHLQARLELTRVEPLT